MAALGAGAKEIEAAGGHIVAVTQGEPQQAQALCDRFQVPFPCLADPRRSSYKAFGLKRGSMVQVLGPTVMFRGLQAARKGHFVEKVVGDAFQLPGTFIIDGDGVVRYARYAAHAADHPAIGELVEALHSLGGGAEPTSPN